MARPRRSFGLPSPCTAAALASAAPIVTVSVIGLRLRTSLRVVFAPGWTTLYAWNNGAATFSIH